MGLTNLEIDQLQQLLNNEVLLNIIKKVFREAAERNRPDIGLLDSDMGIGQKYRAYNTSKGIINAAFIDLLSYKEEKVIKEKELNKGR